LIPKKSPAEKSSRAFFYVREMYCFFWFVRFGGRKLEIPPVSWAIYRLRKKKCGGW
jgi:hypothetical protein